MLEAGDVQLVAPVSLPKASVQPAQPLALLSSGHLSTKCL